MPQGALLCVFCERSHAVYAICRRVSEPALVGVCEGCKGGLDLVLRIFGKHAERWRVVPLVELVGEATDRWGEISQAAIEAAQRIVRGEKP